MDKKKPTNELEAKFSLAYNAAVAWIENNVSPAAFEDTAIADPRYRGVMELTEITAEEGIAQHEAYATADLADGSNLRAHVEHARGTSARPMSDRDLRQKFELALCIGGFDSTDAAADFIMTARTDPVTRILNLLAEGHRSEP
jgi:2-methylcitrate dehydratase PrpD